MMKTLRNGKVVLITDDEFRRIHGDHRPFELPEGPLHPGAQANTVAKSKYHGDQCYCEDCADLRAALDIYTARKAAGDVNDWWNS